MSRTDGFSDFDGVLAAQPLTSPWHHDQSAVHYLPDLDLLRRLVAIPIAAGSVSQSGRFARAIDAWVASELRRAGFETDEVWPRPTPPRVLSHDIATLLSRLPMRLAAQVAERLPDMPSVAPIDARVMGRAYEKQVDVCISRWDRGPELLISTKAQQSSFGKNLPNRFEEAYGDAGNLRGRYPLAAVGYLFVQRATVLTREPDAFERAIDMVRKLRDRGDGNGYTATCLMLIDWADDAHTPEVVVHDDAVPDDVRASRFFARMIDQVLMACPVTTHVAVRERREARRIPVGPERLH